MLPTNARRRTCVPPLRLVSKGGDVGVTQSGRLALRQRLRQSGGACVCVVFSLRCGESPGEAPCDAGWDCRQQGRIIDAVIPHLHNCTNNRTDTGKNCTGDSIYENYEEKEFTSRIMVRHANPIRLCFVPPHPRAHGCPESR
jgi:hypothetical protein